MMNEETKASLNKFLKEREERIKNMTLAEARDIISSTYGHSDMRMESDKALQMLLDCADKTLDQGDVLEKIRAEIEEYKSRQLTLAIGVADLEKGKQIALEYVLAIIDKYRVESEE